METTHVNDQGEAIPAPVLCASKHPKFPDVLCEFSVGHPGPCTFVKVIPAERLGGARKPYIKRLEWQLPEVIT